MHELDELFLEKLGWTVECESPFEIRHFDGSFATKQAAVIVLADLKSEESELFQKLKHELEV